MGNAQSENGFGKNTTTDEVIGDIDLDGKNIIITGSNTGLGKETARCLSFHKANIIMACRNIDKANTAKEEILQKAIDTNLGFEPKLTIIPLDLGSLKSIEKFIEDFEKLELDLHILINNAGVMGTPYYETEDGFESQFGINHVGHFYLTTKLIDNMKATAENSDQGRIVILSSYAHEMYKDGIRFDDITGKGTWYEC
eukprot:TRINITY_DN1349_c1_g3_i3.p1 TRINITY_DN1349_c1_g3~~TRINITY_DN1349_c1_g3_i3.p1  ORF type:complete len:198 (+),score=53.57 TRINITY_DN1349_c1_g3_i3:63-656(+)